MKASALYSFLALVLLVNVCSGTRYTVNFSGLVGRLCGAETSPSGCPDPPPCYISPSVTPSYNPPGSSPSPNPSGSTIPGASGSTIPGASSSSNPGVSGSTTPGASGSTIPGASSSSNPGVSGSTTPGASNSGFPQQSGVVCPTQSTCPVVSTCAPCICATPSSFPSFTSTATPSFTSSLSPSRTGTISTTRSISASLTASPSPNPCGPQYEAANVNSFTVGLLFDRTTSARSISNPAVYGALYAINEINAAGGIRINNKNVSLVPVIYDTQGLPNNTVYGAESLSRVSCASVIIGTENGAQRRAVESAVLDYTGPSNAAPALLLNPQNYGGIDVNPGVVNFGANLNTNVRNALIWAVSNNKSRIHLLGSDDIDSRVINAYARQFLSSYSPSTQIIGEDYFPVGTSEFNAGYVFESPLFIGQSLSESAINTPCPTGYSNCHLLLNSVQGQAANRILFAALAARYLTPNNPDIPYQVLSLRTSPYDIVNFTNSLINNQFIGTNYLEQLDTSASQVSFRQGLSQFIQSAGFNDSRFNTTSGLEVRSYTAIRMWANAVASAGTANPGVIRTAITNTTFNAPNGVITVDPITRNASPATIPFYVSRLTFAARRLTYTTLYQSNDAFTLYPPAAGNLTSPDAFSSLVNGIRSYYLGLNNPTYFNIGLGWEVPAIPSPTSK